MFVEMINAIPNEIGWALVGAMGAYAVMWAHKVGKLFVQMWREWHTEEITE